jgi:hypothetical protein
MRMRYRKPSLKCAARAASVFLLGAAAAFGQTQVNLTAAPTSVTLPDGSAVPMWGYSCGTASPNCAKLNPSAAGWSPVVITVPPGDLQINLTNRLIFPGANVLSTHHIPTSLTIVGQLGGGLGTPGGTTNSPDHSTAQQVTWPIADPTTTGTPPTQGPRVQSFGTEVPANGAAVALTWTGLRSGTYLIESGTHPSIQGPMGLYGILVVTTVPASSAAGTAYPVCSSGSTLSCVSGTNAAAIQYDAEVPLLFSEIDPVQNRAVDLAVRTAGFLEAAVWSAMPGKCGDPAVHSCYPPAVNYTPLYYTINGVAFDKNNPSNSSFGATPASAPATGSVLVRMVNAGLRMHVPSIVGSVTGGTSNVSGFALIAEDGSPLPGVPRVQSEVFMAAGKTYDVMINVPGSGAPALPVYDRELSLSGNASLRDAGMLAYISVNGANPPAFTAPTAAAVADTYNALIAGKTLTVTDAAKGVIANDTNVYSVTLLTPPANGTVTLNTNGTFTYVPTGTSTSDSFAYCANGTVSGSTCSSGVTATVTLGASTVLSSDTVTCTTGTFTSNLATSYSTKGPGLLANCTDSANLPLSIDTSTPATITSGSVSVDANGGFTAALPTHAATAMVTFTAKNSLGKTVVATANITFPAANGPTVKVLDGVDKTTEITDYRWIIEEDRTFYVDPACTTNPLPATCPVVNSAGAPAAFGTNFHTSFMPVVATGCTGPVSCGDGQNQQNAVNPNQVHLDPSKRYYISVLPGDAAQPFINGYASAPDCSPAGVAAGSCGHGMGGAPIAKQQTSVTVLTQPSPYPTAKLTVFVFEDDWPLNGEHDAGGGVDVLSPYEAGLGSFQVTLFDDAGGTGDATGQPTYDMFNMPLTNSLAGTIDPVTHLDACPISPQVTANVTQAGPDATADQCANDPTQKGCQKGIVGMIITCPKYESDGKTLSPLAGQVVVNNLYQGRYGVVATPGADRIAKGEEWLQTNTLDGQKAHDSFMRIGEPAYFQEFGPAGYHVTIGFANPKIINDRGKELCASASCTNELKGHVTMARMSRTPDERLYGSGSRDAFSFTQCYVALGDPDGAAFAFTKCDDQGNFDLKSLPTGPDFKLTIFDQWNDQIVDGISTPVALTGNNQTVDMGEIAAHQWQSNIYTRTFFDQNGNGVSDHDASGNDLEQGLTLVATNNRFRDGSFSNFNNTDLNGYAGFNEIFPLFSWYVVETDSTRYKTTGVHVVYDTGGPTDGTCTSATATCGSSNIGQNFANTYEPNPLPGDLSIPGAVYCAEGADCTTSAASFAAGTPKPSDTTNHSSGRIDPPTWFGSYAWQGFAGQNNFLEFGKKPYVAGENGGIRGHVVYASTRPFDDPQLLLQTSWEPLVPHVRINLYKEGVAADGVTQTLTLIDHTETSSFDDWAQGFRTDGKPNISCPGQSTTDPFYFGLIDQPNYLNWYNAQHGGPAVTQLPYHSQYKCYDGMHNWNQVQPVPYDGMYSFPSVNSIDPATGKPAGTNCTACTTDPDQSDPYRYGTPMLPAGKYVVEVVVPDGYELVKEEDKNILIGDNFIAPVTQQFGGLTNIFILPDQAAVGSTYNPNNPLNPTNSLGRSSNLVSHEGDTGSVESYWPCVGAAHVVPAYISLFPGSRETAPFAGATRNLCDRKEVTLEDQTSALAKFYVFTQTHTAAHFTGLITDDFTGEFDPFSPQFGEKFAPAYLPVSVKDWAGNETQRVYSDEFGAYNGLSYSTWEVNPPNPTGYGPTMMVVCMNDSGTGATADPLFQPAYSQFCYELPFMPGQTGYFDTPVVPTSSFSEGYNHPDCNYPDATPAISSVTGSDGIAGPWVSAAGSGHTLTITALGDQMVDSYAYSGPQVTTAPFNQQKVKRHYGFGATAGTVALVGSDGVSHPLTGVSWGDTTITGTVPSGVPACAVQQQAQYGGPGTPGVTNALCGQLVITAANGKQSIDAVTVTIGGKKPTVLAAGKTIQSAIDAAYPGDLIIVPAGVYNELVLMWKPIRLQGVGAASSVINANTHPAGQAKLDPWRKKVVCLFGLTPDGQPNPSDTSCSSGWTAASGGPDYPTMIVDRVPMEGILGWDTTVNGNLAEQLIEPSLMGAFEGAAITVLGKGVKIPAGATDVYGSGAESAFPTGSTLLDNSTAPLTGRNSDPNGCGPNTTTAKNPYPTNYYCNPSSIDGLALTNSSQGGGGIFVHAWAHSIQIANNRVYNNTGTMSGGITIGQGEHTDLSVGGSAATNVPPGSCESSIINNLSLPYCYNMNVNVHNNAVTLNSSLGDELFSSTPAGAGGVSFCNGADYYKFQYNWVCGNMSTGDGGGLAHIGFSKNGTIAHNSILFNQSTNPTITTNGGGVLVMGAPDPAITTCGTTTDQDCVPDPSTILPSDGTGPGLVIDANLILGNSADSGSGGGLRFQHVNGTDVVNFPNGAVLCLLSATCPWNSVTVTNNIITNNVAGWDGAGVSLQDALNVNIINNTIASNDSTAASGVLFDSLFAPLASTPGTNCTVNNGSQSCPQVAGLVSVTNSPVLKANLPSNFSCAPGHGTGGSCKNYSVPLLYNNVIWQNRSFFIGVTQPTNNGGNSAGQQSTIALFNSFTNTPAANQSATGACPTASYWDLGVRGDQSVNGHESGYTLSPMFSVLSPNATIYDHSNLTANPLLAGQYCNGSRVPPELGSMGYLVYPGTNETNALPTPVFSLTPSATVDEGNNWVNMRWGPLALTHPTTGATLGNYALSAGSPAIGDVTLLGAPLEYVAAPATDFFGTNRKTDSKVDIGAVEFVAPPGIAIASVTGGPLSFGNQTIGTTSAAQSLTLQNTGGAQLTGIAVTVTAPFSRNGGTCATTLNAGASCTINIVFAPTVAQPYTGSATLNASVTVNGSPVALTGTGTAPTISATLTPTTWTTSANRGIGLLGPSQLFTLTNTGNAPLTGITKGALGGASSADFAVVALFSTCGPAGGGQLVGTTTLAPGATCVVDVQFRPRTTDAHGSVRAATISVSDAAGTQTSTLSGTVN